MTGTWGRNVSITRANGPGVGFGRARLSSVLGRHARRISLLALVVLLLSASAALAAPAGPALVGSVSDTSSSTSLSSASSTAVAGQYAYTTAYNNGTLTAVDISNHAAPFVAGSSAVATSLFGGATVNLAGGYAYVASKNRNQSMTSNDDGTGNSLTILDIHSNPAVPAKMGTLHDSMNLFGAYGVAVSGTFAYVAAQGLLKGEPTSPDTSTGSFSVIDVSNPAAPAIVGHLDNGSLPAPWTGTNALAHITSVFVSGTYAYVTAFNSGRLTIIDISNPASPTIVASLHSNNVDLVFPNDVAVSGNYAYVADQTATSTQSNLTVVDVSNPTSPHVVGSVIGQSAVLAGAYRVRVDGSFAYVSALNTATVGVIDVSNPASPRVAGWVKDTTKLNVSIGLDFDPSGGYIIATSVRLPGQAKLTYPPYTPSLSTGTVSAIQLDPNPIAVTIAPASKPPSGTNQTSANFTFATSDQIAAVRCQLDGAPLGPCTSPTNQQYSSLSQGHHSFTVQATDALGNTSADTYTWGIGPAPVNTTPPAISGTVTVGSQLSASTGTWSGTPAPSFSYQWGRCDANGSSCSAISGATGQTYTPAPADLGSTLEVAVTGTNTAGSTSATSSPTGLVTGSTAPANETVPTNTKVPVISGTAAIGQKLSCSTGSWTGSAPISYSYSWIRDGTRVPHATRATYLLGSGDAGHKLACSVQAANSAGTVTATSAALPAPGGSGSVGRARLLGRGAIRVKVTCANIAGTVCRLSLTLTVTEFFSGRKLTAVTAATKTTKTTKVVLLASASIQHRAGAHQTVKLTLNRAGLQLLSKLHKLPAKLSLAETGSNRHTSTVTVQTLTLR